MTEERIFQMGRPQFYINVSQTIAVGTIALFIGSYIFRKGFRDDVNDMLKGISSRAYYC